MESSGASTNKMNIGSLVNIVLAAGRATVDELKISYISGFVLGTAGRLTGAEQIPALPIVIDLWHGIVPTSERVAHYMAYGAGVATAYTDKVYSFVADIVDKL